MTTNPQQLEIAGHLLAGLMSQTLSDEPLVRQKMFAMLGRPPAS